MSAYDPTDTYKKRSFRNIPHQLRLRRIEKVIKAICTKRKIDSYLDLGCASGFITDRIKTLLNITEVVGTDSLQEYIDRATRHYPDVRFIKMDLNQASKPDPEFDLVTCFETLEHVGSLENALQNIHLSLKPGGIGLISVPIETGPVGIVKYLLKSKIYGDKLNEISPENQKRYLTALIKGEDISVFRKPERALWWDHFGFNFEKIDAILSSRKIRFKTANYFTTRFVIIYKD